MNKLNNIVPDLFDAAITEQKMGIPTISHPPRILGSDSNLLIVFYVQIMPDDLVMQLHRF